MKFRNRTCRLNTSFHFIVTIAKGVSNPNPFWKTMKKSTETKGWSKSWHIPSLWNHLNSRKMSGSKWTKLFHQCTCHLCQGIYQKVWRTSLTDQRVSWLKFSNLAIFLGGLVSFGDVKWIRFMKGFIGHSDTFKICGSFLNISANLYVQLQILFNLTKTWLRIVCWFSWISLFLPVLAWCDHKIVQQIKTILWSRHASFGLIE